MLTQSRGRDLVQSAANDIIMKLLIYLRVYTYKSVMYFKLKKWRETLRMSKEAWSSSGTTSTRLLPAREVLIEYTTASG